MFNVVCIFGQPKPPYIRDMSQIPWTAKTHTTLLTHPRANERQVCMLVVTASSFLPSFLSLCPCVSWCFTNCQGRLKNYPFNLLTKERGSNFSGPEIGGVSHPLLETKYNARSRQIRTNYRAVQMIVNF